MFKKADGSITCDTSQGFNFELHVKLVCRAVKLKQGRKKEICAQGVSARLFAVMIVKPSRP